MLGTHNWMIGVFLMHCRLHDNHEVGLLLGGYCCRVGSFEYIASITISLEAHNYSKSIQIFTFRVFLRLDLYTS